MPDLGEICYKGLVEVSEGLIGTMIVHSMMNYIKGLPGVTC